MARQPSSSLQDETTPTVYPEVPPPRYPLHGHDFTLQTVIELQRSIGELSAKTDRLIADVKSHSDKIDRIRLTLAWVAGGAAVVGVLVGAGITIAVKMIPIIAPSAH
jgi:hypothetical protein